jgi:lauroyl/myristoyl acyltransferase
MEPYIRHNTDLRKRAMNDFEKDLYKQMNNSTFAKTMGNLRKRVDVKLVRSSEEDRIRKLIAKPN